MTPRFTRSSSIFSAIRERELHRLTVNSRPSVAAMTSDGACSGSGILVVEPNGTSAPPLAVSFGKTVDKSHLLAVADEDGFVSIFNTRHTLPSITNAHSATDNARKELWMAHGNAVFDLCWIQEDRRMLTGSGDQTVRLWDVEARAGLGVMKGHSGSVKTLSGHPSHPDVFASGSRDGNVAIWDVRSRSSQNASSEKCFQPVSWIKDAHLPGNTKRSRGSKATTKSVTAVLYLRDDRILATAGAADGAVKFWDTRQLKSPVVQTPPEAQASTDGKEKRVHGTSGLSQNPSGTSIITSCTDSRIYLYDVQKPERGSVSSFYGHIMGSFYIKAVFSPDGTHILSGSSDGNVFIWEVDSKGNDPVILRGHTGEVTAVDWCSTDFCKVATCSDDFTVRVWKNVEPKFESHHRRPSAIRRRITADPGCVVTCFADGNNNAGCVEAGKQAITEAKHCENMENASSSSVFVRNLGGYNTDDVHVPEIQSIQESGETEQTNAGSCVHLLESSPVSKVKESPLPRSPASVLDLPGSCKRRKTITDYFGH